MPSTIKDACDDWVLLEDVSAQFGGKTITNDAEQTVKTMHELRRLKQRRLFYVDTDGRIDELLHDGNGKFLGFGHGHDGVKFD